MPDVSRNGTGAAAASGLPALRLVAGPALADRSMPPLDDVQRAAVAHAQGSGPLVVLGAPGSGKTTTLVECLVARVDRDGVAPDGVLALAPTRRAATSLRDRVAARLGRTVREPLARTAQAYCFGLLRRVRVLDGDPVPRLISGPEQDRILAELLAGHELGEGRVPAWPSSVGPQVRALRGFRDELRDLLMRAVERGLSPADLARLGRRADRPDWVAAADVLGEYLDVTSLATPGGYDPAGIVDAATVLLAEDADLLEAERQRWAVVAVDDAHEATAATQRLLDLLAGPGRDLLLVGDPDVATQTFRGARPRLLAEAADRFPRADGRPATVVVLRTVHRHGPLLRAAAGRVTARIGSSGVVAHRGAPSAGVAGSGQPGESVAVRVLSSAAQEAAYVAQYVRRHHLELGVPWARMAVVVRSSRATQPLRRALSAAGVPVSVPAAEVPVRDEPAVVPLRLALRCALDPSALTHEVAVQLLTGQLGAVDTVGLRRLKQRLRSAELTAGGSRGSDVLLAEALAQPSANLLPDGQVTRGARRVASVLAAGREARAVAGANAETVLWALWDAAGLGQGWRRTALAGGLAGARADRDLDAVVALFEAAARYVDRLPRNGPEGFLDYLEGEEVPADTLADRAPDTDAITLLTAQGAVGREWDVVAVPGVQEGSWPDLRLRSSLLGAQALADLLDGRAPDGPQQTSGGPSLAGQRAAVLDDELRLFLVAVSRARRHLLVTAVRSEEELPSPLLDLVDPLPDDVELRPLSDVPRSMTLSSLVAALRAQVCDPGAPDLQRRDAGRALADLVSAGVPGADPDDWYGVADLSAPGGLRRDGEEVRVSPSRVEQFTRCGLRWLLESTGGSPASSAAQSLGTLVHELAQECPEGDLDRLLELFEARVERLALGGGWVGRREKDRARRMLARLSQYTALARGAGRELVAAECPVEIQVGRAVVRGNVDRLERDPEGRLVVADLKTGRSGPTSNEVARHAQLGVYQLAVEEGGSPARPSVCRPAGAPCWFTWARRPGRSRCSSRHRWRATTTRNGPGFSSSRWQRQWQARRSRPPGTRDAEAVRYGAAARCTPKDVRWGSEPAEGLRGSGGRAGDTPARASARRTRRGSCANERGPDRSAGGVSRADRAGPRAPRTDTGAGRGHRSPAAAAACRGRSRLGQDGDHGRPGRLAGGQRLRRGRRDPRSHVHPEGRCRAGRPSPLAAAGIAPTGVHRP